MKATHEISAVFFPHVLEVELTWKDIETDEVAVLLTKVSEEIGNQIAKVILPCVYHGAIVKGEIK